MRFCLQFTPAKIGKNESELEFFVCTKQAFDKLNNFHVNLQDEDCFKNRTTSLYGTLIFLNLQKFFEDLSFLCLPENRKKNVLNLTWLYWFRKSENREITLESDSLINLLYYYQSFIIRSMREIEIKIHNTLHHIEIEIHNTLHHNMDLTAIALLPYRSHRGHLS